MKVVKNICTRTRWWGSVEERPQRHGSVGICGQGGPPRRSAWYPSAPGSTRLCSVPPSRLSVQPRRSWRGGDPLLEVVVSVQASLRGVQPRRGWTGIGRIACSGLRSAAFFSGFISDRKKSGAGCLMPYQADKPTSMFVTKLICFGPRHSSQDLTPLCACVGRWNIRLHTLVSRLMPSDSSLTRKT